MEQHLKRNAFTLVEALVVIGILSTLLAILLPAASSARASARAAECQSNLRQLGIASTAYAAQNADHYPPALLYKMQPEGLSTIAWDFETRANGSVTPGALWSFIGGANKVQQCPEFLGASTSGNDPFTGYNYNTTYIGAEGRFPTMDPTTGKWIDGWNSARRGLRAGQIRHTTKVALFGDGGWRGGANKFMRAPSNAVENDLSLVAAGAQAFRHKGCTAFCAIDGHITSCAQSCAGANTTEPLQVEVMDFPNNGFLSEDDAAYDPSIALRGGR